MTTIAAECTPTSPARSVFSSDRSILHTPQAVAELGDRRITELSREELIDLVASFQHFWTEEDLTGRLCYADERVLQQLAYLARQCCRSRQNVGRRDLAT